MSAARKPAILVLSPYMRSFAPELAGEFDLLDRDEATGAEAERVVAIITTGGTQDAVPASLMDRLPNLRMIANLGSGLSPIDLDAARTRGVVVTRGATTHGDQVADHAVLLALAAWQDLFELDRMSRAGEWRQGQFPPTRRSLTRARVGIVGMGVIGQEIAHKLAPICPDIRWWAPRPQDLAWPRAASLAELADWCDILILAARGDRAIGHLITAQVIDAIGPRGIFVNVARGYLVDEDALIAALRSGRLRGAALDVFAQEPIDAARWKDVPGTILTPHCAGATDLGMERARDQLIHNLRSLITGEPPRGLVAGP